MKIYTRTGDKGTTALYGGGRVEKDSPYMQAVGTVDECNSALGCAISHLPTENALDVLRSQLIIIQHALFDIGAALATPLSQSNKRSIEKTRFADEAISEIEGWIDEMDEDLPALTQFILPGGHTCGANLHLARSICRRAERLSVPIHLEKDVEQEVVVYLNRLSDYLFVAARWINHKLKVPETSWHHR